MNNYCRNCGLKIDKEYDYCLNCNTKVINKRIDVNEIKKIREKNKKLAPFYNVIIIMLFILHFILYEKYEVISFIPMLLGMIMVVYLRIKFADNIKTWLLYWILILLYMVTFVSVNFIDIISKYFNYYLASF